MTEQTKPLAEQSPSEIDVQLAALYEQEAKALSQLSAAGIGIHRVVGDRQRGYSRDAQWGLTFAEALTKAEEMVEAEPVTYKNREAERAIESLGRARKALAAVRAEAKPLNEEFSRRGGWTRAFLAKSANGHVHNGMDCSTCNKMGKSTSFGWFPEYSGRPESEIVEDAGERACTTCYPTAPVSVLSRPTKFFSEDEVAAAKAREERAVKRAAAEVEKVVVEGITEGSTRYAQSKTFKTLRAATQFATSSRAKVISWGGNHPSVPLWEADADKVEAAIAAKTGRDVDEVSAEIKAKALKSAKRNR